MNAALWTVQTLLALLFLFAGGMKLVMPLEALQGPVPLPGWFMRFIGVVEVLGGIGLILPALLGIRPGLTPLAAAGLVVVMIGATAITAMGGDVAMSPIPFVVGLGAAFVAYGRWQLLAGRAGPRASTRPGKAPWRSTGCSAAAGGWRPGRARSARGTRWTSARWPCRRR
jgi:hypothetical protein